MSNFNYVMTGSIGLLGCGCSRFHVNQFLKYSVGQDVYTRFEAENGILEIVRIDEIRVRRQSLPIYVDRNHAVYVERELCLLDEAMALVTIHKQSLLQMKRNTCHFC